MSNNRDERELRRAAVQLSQCRIEDIEWIWSKLDSRQRDRLRPLLAELKGTYRDTLSHSEVQENSATSTDETPGVAIDKLVSYFNALPAEYEERFRQCLPEDQRQALITAPLGRHRDSTKRPATLSVRMTPHAVQSIRRGIWQVCASDTLQLSTIKPLKTSSPSRIFRWLKGR